MNQSMTLHGMRAVAFAALIVLCGSLPALAQNAESPQDLAQRMELAQKMHQMRPAALQVQEAIDQASESLPEGEREAFRARMKQAIDIEALERTSISAMARVFTPAELERMIAYYSTPEAASIAQKMPQYQRIVQPEIVKMLDKALMDIRTGKAPAAP